MRHFLDSALAPVRRFRLVAQDGFASVVLCLLVVALVFEATPPRFLAGPLLNLAAPSAETYSAVAPRVMAGSPELDDAPTVEVAADVGAPSPPAAETVQAEDRRQKKAGTAKTVAATDESGGGAGSGSSGDPTTSADATIPPAPSPIGPCRGNASANSTKHASSSGLRNGTGHGCG